MAFFVVGGSYRGVFLLVGEPGNSPAECRKSKVGQS